MALRSGRGDQLALLKAAAMSGADQVAPALAPDVTLDASLTDLPRTRLIGAEAVLAELRRWWAGEGTLVDWRQDDSLRGSTVTLERLDERGGPSRRRLYVHVDREARISALWAYSARPRPSAAGPRTGVPEKLVDRVAPGGRREPLDDRGGSGAALDRIVADDGGVLVAKRVAPGDDWIARATGDPGREALLPYPALPTAVVAVEADRHGWWVLMRDVGSVLIPSRSVITRSGARAMLTAAARLHRTFARTAPVKVACSLERLLTLHAPATAEAERAGCDIVPKQLEVGWEGFVEAAPPDVADAVIAALDDPRPLAERLRSAAPSTLVHGDLRGDNVARLRGGSLLIDWGRATWAPATVELGWFLLHTSWRAHGSRETLIDAFLDAESETPSDEAVRLGLLTGLVTCGWQLGHGATVHPNPAVRAWAHDEIAWFSERCRPVLA